MATESMGGVRKKARQDAANGGFVPSKKLKPSLTETESFPTGIGTKSKPCTKFFSSESVMTPQRASQPIKLLNTGPGRRRFVFKTFSQRIEDVDITAFRNLEPVKPEPTGGSTFFKDTLMYWRELNTAGDFISLYMELIPFVQTLPQILHHKDSLVSKLTSRLNMKASLSLEPILRLITVLSRDLQVEFVPFLQRICQAVVHLLHSGGDREPDVLEHVFTSLSHIFMYLQKFLVKDIVAVLRMTKKLRFYPRDHVQEFMAEGFSFLLRSATAKELIKGIRKLCSEVVKFPTSTKKTGISILLWHILKGSSSRLHSKAKRVLLLLMDNSTYEYAEKIGTGSNTFVEVVKEVFIRISEELRMGDLEELMKCLFEEICNNVRCLETKDLPARTVQRINSSCSEDGLQVGSNLPCLRLGLKRVRDEADDTAGSLRHISRLLFFAGSILRVDNGRKFSDYHLLFEIMGLLIQNFVMTSDLKMMENAYLCEVVDHILQLMVIILGIPRVSGDISMISSLSTQWGCIFEIRSRRVFTFLKGLLLKDSLVVHAFQSYILGFMNEMIESFPHDILYMMLIYYEKVNGMKQMNEETSPDVIAFFEKIITFWITQLSNDEICGVQRSVAALHEAEVAKLWAILTCYPYVASLSNISLLMDLLNAIDLLLVTETDKITGQMKITWESLIGAALSSYRRSLTNEAEISNAICKYLYLAKKYKTSPHVLSSVADFLDGPFSSTPDQASSSEIVSSEELRREATLEAFDVFADNLGDPHKEIRLFTLKILCHYEPVDLEPSVGDQRMHQRRSSTSCSEDPHNGDVVQLLLSVEAASLSVMTIRSVQLLVSKLQMELSAARISEAYIPVLLHGIIGVLHNRFSDLQKTSVDCLAILLERYAPSVWGGFIKYLRRYLLALLACQEDSQKASSSSNDKLTDLVDRFQSFLSHESDSTPPTFVLVLLLQSLQKVSSIAEAYSHEIVPLFFKFLGYDSDALVCIEQYDFKVCKGKEWRSVLKEWLNLFQKMQNVRSLWSGNVLKDVLINRFLDDPDSDIQMNVMDVLSNWKDDALLPYVGHLKNLINMRVVREELTTWNLSKESSLIPESHRHNLIPLVVRVLMPKIRKVKSSTSRKNAGAIGRKAILCFLAQLEIEELSLFFSLCFQSMRILPETFSFHHPSDTTVEEYIQKVLSSDFLKMFTANNVEHLPLKRIYGFLRVLEDCLKTFDESHMLPFLGLLMSLVGRILECFTSNLVAVKSTTSLHARNCGVVETSMSFDVDKHPSLLKQMEYAKAGGSVCSPGIEVAQQNVTEQMSLDESCSNPDYSHTDIVMRSRGIRSLCLKILSFVLNKYESCDLGSDFWNSFFTSIDPLIENFTQESSSSENPSSLFSCFLAMSKNSKLVHLLERKATLVPSIFSILSVNSSSMSIISAVLSFVENLLMLDEETGDNISKQILLPHLGTLIHNLNGFVVRHNGYDRKSISLSRSNELRLFVLLLKYIKEPSLGKPFLAIVVQFLGKKGLDSDQRVEAMHIIRQLVPALDGSCIESVLNLIPPLLITAGSELRLAICDVLDCLSEGDASLNLTAKLVHDLNAMSVLEIDELDYETRIKAYEKINLELFSKLKIPQAMVILSHCVYDMSSPELQLRQSASRSLLVFIELSRLVLEDAFDKCADQSLLPHRSDGICPTHGTCWAEHCWTKAAIHRVVHKFFLLHMREAMGKEIYIQKEWIALLREMVLQLSGIPMLQACYPLCSMDAEVDFFNNILHLQKHRRARALLRFKDVFCSHKIHEEIALKVFSPLFFRILFDLKDGADEHVRKACLEALASMSISLQWHSYYKYLMHCFREMRLKSDKSKDIVRLICFLLDMFHYYSGADSNHDDIEVSNHLDEGGRDIPLEKKSSESVPPEIQNSLQKSVLPEILKIMSSASCKINAPINLAALKLLKLLPSEIMDSQLSGILHRIINFLRSRMESERDEARLALAACTKELGAKYLTTIIKILRSTLKRGYELHVLGYSVNFVLSKIEPCSTEFDLCLEELLSVVERDIFGDVAEQKEVGKIASKMKEARKTKSFETLKLIARSITFNTSAPKLFSPLKAHLVNPTPRDKARLEEMLRSIAEGIEANGTVNQTDLLVFVYGLIEDYLAYENCQSAELSGLSTAHHSNSEKSEKSFNIFLGNGSNHLIAAFALRILHNRMKKMKLDRNDPVLLSMLDPYVGLLQNCLQSKYEDILAGSLRCLTMLIRLPLPSFQQREEKIMAFILDLAQKPGKSDSLLIQASLKLLTRLLRLPNFSCSTVQLQMLMQFPLFVDLENSPIICLSLLKALVARKLVVPQIYDAVCQVSKLMVTSQSPAISRKCSRIFLQFLMDYPCNPKRLQQHMHFLVENMSYEHASGREAVLEMLHSIIKKFQEKSVNNLAETFTLPLVLRLANERDKQIHAMVAKVIKILLGRVKKYSTPSTLQNIMGYALSWYTGENPNLYSAAAQFLGLLVEVLKGGFSERYVYEILPVLERILKAGLVINEKHGMMKEKCVDDATHSLQMVDKLLLQFPHLCSQTSFESMWQLVIGFLMHPVERLQESSSCLINSYFNTTSNGAFLKEKESLEEAVPSLLKLSSLFAIAASHCCQLEAHTAGSNCTSNIIVGNLVVSIYGVHSFAKQNQDNNVHEFWSSLSSSDHEVILKFLEVLGAKGEKRVLSLFGNEYPSDDLASLLVVPLLRKLCSAVLQSESLEHVKMVFGCISLISTRIGPESCIKYADTLLVPLYKICEGFAGKVFSDEAIHVAEDLRDHLRGIMGKEEFVRAYDRIRKDVRLKREKRKQVEKLTAVVNPMRSAKRKLRISEKHRAHKKRKLMLMKMGKWRRV